MATTKELKALITLAGKIDPSLQTALLKSQKGTKAVASQMGLLQLAGKSAGTAIKAGASTAAAAMTRIAPRVTAVTTNMVAMAAKNKVVQASFVTLRRIGTASFTAIKVASKAALVGLGAMALAGVAAFGALIKVGTKTASDLTEVQNVVDVTFGDGSEKVNSWSQSLLKSYGLAELSAKKYSSTIGAMLKSSGLAGDDVLTMSQNLTMLTGDMASFYNLKPDEMFDKIKSGISGETEPLKALGINMNVANLEAFALSQGITKSYSAMSQAEQTALRYNYIMQATKDSQGDFARTSDSLSNQTKLLKENFTQLAGKVMTNAVPAFAKILQGVNGFITSLNTDDLGSFINTIADLAAELLPVAIELMPAIQSTISAILPPLMQVVKMLLPPLTKFMQFVGKALSSILPPLMDIIGVVIPPIADFLGLLIDAASYLVGKAGDALGKVAGWFKGMFGGEESGGTVRGFANGGFSSKPAIFGEAGLEAAIPIKPGNKRSMMLLQKTAQLLGVQGSAGGDTLSGRVNGISTGSSQFVYAPVIQGSSAPQIVDELRRQGNEFMSIYQSFMNREGRMAFG